MGPGDHRWVYEWPRPDVRLTLESKLRDVRSHPAIWDALSASVSTHFNIDLSASDEMLDLSLDEALARSGEASPELQRDLRRILAPHLELS